MMNDIECSSDEKAMCFTNSYAYNFASVVGIIYMLIVPFFAVVFPLWIFLAIIGALPNGSNSYETMIFVVNILKYTIIANFIAFIFFLLNNKPINKRKSFVVSKIVAPFAFVIFILVSFVPFIQFILIYFY